MKKLFFYLPLTHAKNFIILLGGLLMSLGIGPLHIGTIIVYLLFTIFALIFRTKYFMIFLSVFLIAFSLFMCQFCYNIATPHSFQVNNIVSISFVIISAIASFAYCILNYRLIKKGKIDVNE